MALALFEQVRVELTKTVRLRLGSFGVGALPNLGWEGPRGGTILPSGGVRLWVS